MKDIKQTDKSARIMGYLPVYLVVDMILKWIAMYTGIRNGVISAIILFGYTMVIFAKRNFSLKLDGMITKAVAVYVIDNMVLALVSYVKGYPLSLLLSEASNTLVPMVVFFIAKNITFEQAKDFEKTEFFVAIVLLVSGMYYNITLNDPYYIEFLRISNKGFALWWFSAAPRLTSFYGSVICGTVGCVVAILAFRNIDESNKRLFWFPYLVGVLLAILTLQRSAMVAIIMISGYLIFYFIQTNKLRPQFLVVAGLLFLAAVIFLRLRYPVVLDAVIRRFGQVKNAIGERNNGWLNAFSNGPLAVLGGFGFGTGGQRAIGITEATVNDGNYFKIIFDLGIVGLSIFVFIVYQILKKGIKEKKTAYVAVIVCFLFQMIGSNLLTFGSTAVLFWYAAGRIVCNERQSQRTEDMELTQNMKP